jgi:hypothetical protein
LQAREQLVVDVAVRVRDRVGIFERLLLRVAEERTLRVVVECLDLLCRNAETCGPRRTPELALFVKRFAQVFWARLDVDRRDARFSVQQGPSSSSGILGALVSPYPISCES